MRSPARSPNASLISATHTAYPISTISPSHQSHLQSMKGPAEHLSTHLDEKSTLESSQSSSMEPHFAPSPTSRTPTRSTIPAHVHSPTSPVAAKYSRPRLLRITNLLRLYSPILIYLASSLGFLVAIAFWQTEVFAALDELSFWLRQDLLRGYAYMFGLIFLTTFPPFPLYSTLIVLSGYTFGAWGGAVVSYSAALSGAITVFLLTRTFLRERVSRWLSSAVSVKRVVRAIEKKPSLLFLIRVCPYPYNVMNCLLAASPTLSFEVYTLATAISLFKVIIHTSLGASIHSFKGYHTHETPEQGSESHAGDIARWWTIIGIAACFGILIYLGMVARKAVEEELQDDESEEERIAFLASAESEMDLSMSLSRTSTSVRVSLSGSGGRNWNVDEEASIGL